MTRIARFSASSPSLRTIFTFPNLSVSLSRTAAKTPAKYPLLPGEEYWIHVEESYLGPLFARGAKHLIKWDGSKITILEEAFEHWIS